MLVVGIDGSSSSSNSSNSSSSGTRRHSKTSTTAFRLLVGTIVEAFANDKGLLSAQVTHAFLTTCHAASLELLLEKFPDVLVLASDAATRGDVIGAMVRQGSPLVSLATIYQLGLQDDYQGEVDELTRKAVREGMNVTRLCAIFKHKDDRALHHVFVVANDVLRECLPAWLSVHDGGTIEQVNKTMSSIDPNARLADKPKELLNSCCKAIDALFADNNGLEATRYIEDLPYLCLAMDYQTMRWLLISWKDSVESRVKLSLPIQNPANQDDNGWVTLMEPLMLRSPLFAAMVARAAEFEAVQVCPMWSLFFLNQ